MDICELLSLIVMDYCVSSFHSIVRSLRFEIIVFKICQASIWAFNIRILSHFNEIIKVFNLLHKVLRLLLVKVPSAKFNVWKIVNQIRSLIWLCLNKVTWKLFSTSLAFRLWINQIKLPLCYSLRRSRAIKEILRWITHRVLI